MGHAGTAKLGMPAGGLTPGMLPPGGLMFAGGDMYTNEALMDALRADDLPLARRLVQQRADINYEDPNSRKTPLHIAVETNGSIDAVHYLLKAKANVNAETAQYQTPMHLAIKNYNNISPLVVRMLLCNHADLNIQDWDGMTPLNSMRIVSMQAAQMASEGTGQHEATNIRQILHEVTEQPTIDVGVVEGQKEVLSAHFADAQNDLIVFNTESSIAMYSLQQKRITFMKKLKQQQVQFTVKHVSVNPELGTLAVCLDRLDLDEMGQGGTPTMRNVFIIWPHGKIQDSEPLKLSISVGPNPLGYQLPVCALLSRGRGPQFLLGRLVDGKVFSWCLNVQRSELESEVSLASEGAVALATSDDGFWIAAVVNGEGGPRLKVWTYNGPNGRLHTPALVFDEPKAPQSIAIQQADATSALMAMCEPVTSGTPLPHIEVRAVSTAGASRIKYRLKVPSACRSLSFCHGSATHVFTGHYDGLILLYDLPRGTTSQCHGSPNDRSISISVDRSMVVSTEQHCFRIFRVTDPSAT